MRYLSYLMLIIGLFTLILGCDEEEQPKESQETELRVVMISPADGCSFSTYSSITVTFSKRVASVTMMLNGVPIKATTSGKVVVSSIVPDDLSGIPGSSVDCVGSGESIGDFTLTIEATDEDGQNLVDFTPVTYTIIPDDCWPPRICGVKCDPQNGTVDVDPEEYPEKLIIAFNEAVSEVKVLSTDPKFSFTEELIEDNTKLEIGFVNYTMPYGTAFAIRISATDLAGNTQDLLYSFTTVARERI